MDHIGRLLRLKKRMDHAGCSACVLAPGAMLKYLTGFTDDPHERLLLCLVPLEGDPVFVAPKLFASQIRSESLFPHVREWTDTDGPGDALQTAAADLGLAGKRVLVDEIMPLSSYLMLEKAASRSEFVPGRAVMADLRASKEPEELGAMKRAARIADSAFAAVLDRGIVGLTEAEVSLALKLEMLAQGADDTSFEPIIAAGPNGAVGHHRPGLRVITEGDAVIMDFGCRIDGYCSDVTRTVFCTSPSTEMEKVYEVVRSAQEAAVNAVEPGVTAEEIDRVANELVLASGMGTWHRTGHGIGLDIHEPPYIVTGNPQVLEKGMAFSVEPGIYLPGRFGVRIEDVVVVTEVESEAMSELTRSIVVVS